MTKFAAEEIHYRIFQFPPFYFLLNILDPKIKELEFKKMKIYVSFFFSNKTQYLVTYIGIATSCPLYQISASCCTILIHTYMKIGCV